MEGDKAGSQSLGMIRVAGSADWTVGEAARRVAMLKVRNALRMIVRVGWVSWLYETGGRAAIRFLNAASHEQTQIRSFRLPACALVYQEMANES